MTTTRPARLLFVHAHPDDETLTCGITMAHYRAQGHDVHVLTCTLGEEGEVIPADLGHLVADRDDTLGPYRREELREAMTRLGVSHAVLGQDESTGRLSRWRDSGMAGSPAAAREHAWVNADPAEAVDHLRDHLDALMPDVVVTYDDHGGYGHPDHIQTHLLTLAAVATIDTAVRPDVAVVLTPRSWAMQDRRWLQDHVPRDAGLLVLGDEAPYPPSVVDDEVVTHEVLDAQVAGLTAYALAAHATQVAVSDGYHALSNNIAARTRDREGFAFVDPSSGRLLGPEPGLPGRRRGLLRESPS